MTWVKICGITNLEDARLAVDAGADAIGFVFYEKSPRKVTLQAAGEIAAKLPPCVEKAGVFVDEASEAICNAAAIAGLTAAQVHLIGSGTEGLRDLMDCKRRDGLKLIAALPADQLGQNGWTALPPASQGLYALMLDSGSSALPGGTGRAFDWEQAKRTIQGLDLRLPLIVAGGLTPERVRQAIAVLRPWGVDVSSGVEARPGKKDPEKVRAFIAAVRDADTRAAGRDSSPRSE
jgi:phosphoribosylanthranilate isomerase